MKKRIKTISLALVIGLGGLTGGIWLLSLTLGNHGSLYEGKPLNFWIEQVNSHDTTTSNQANAVLINVIIPRLTKAMFQDTNDSSLRLALIDKLNGLPGILIYFTPAERRRAEAANGLGEFGPAAKTAIPVLIQALKAQDEAVRGPAAKALGEIHCEPEVIIPLLITYLDDQDVNAEAAEALGDFGPQAKAAVPKLITYFGTLDHDLHGAVWLALKQIDPDAFAKALQELESKRKQVGS